MSAIHPGILPGSASAARAGQPPALPETREPISQAGELRSARVESLRALAALSVFVGHTFAIALTFQAIFVGLKNRILLGGGLGVFLFFTLSGYLLFWPFARQHLDGGPGLDLRRYARNRALRILPLYWAAVALLYALAPGGASPGDWWRYALFLQNYSGRTTARLDSPMWSLAVEIQFYILLPLLAWVIVRVGRSSLRGAAVVLGALAGASVALRYTTALGPHSDYTGVLTGRYALPTLFFFFAGGMLLALLRLAWERRRPGWLTGTLASADAWLMASIPLWVIAAWTLFEPVTALAGFMVVAACVLPLRRGRLVRVLEWRPLATLGLASYSLYLWHVPILLRLSSAHVVFASTGAWHDTGQPHDFKLMLAIATPVVCAVALLSYAVIEAPFLRLRRHWGEAGVVRGNPRTS